MLNSSQKLTLAGAAFRQEWRTAALPVAFVLLAVELQQHWQGNGHWVYLAAVALISICWISALFGQAWAVRGAGTSIDAVALLLLIGGGWLALLGSERGGSDPISTLTFWAPLLCVWWALSLGDGFGRLAVSMAALYSGMFFFQADTDKLFLPRLLLGILLVLLVRFAGERYSRLPKAGWPDQPADDPLIDALPGVASPSYFEAELAHTAAVADRYQLPFSLIACRVAATTELTTDDADFASVKGQELLVGIARALVDLVRIADTVCRWEGGKFFVLLPNTRLAQASAIAGKIRAVSHSIASSNNYSVVIQIGVCEHRPGEDPMQTFMVADDALSEATASTPEPSQR